MMWMTTALCIFLVTLSIAGCPQPVESIIEFNEVADEPANAPPISVNDPFGSDPPRTINLGGTGDSTQLVVVVDLAVDPGDILLDGVPSDTATIHMTATGEIAVTIRIDDQLTPGVHLVEITDEISGDVVLIIEFET